MKHDITPEVEAALINTYNRLVEIQDQMVNLPSIEYKMWGEWASREANHMASVLEAKTGYRLHEANAGELEKVEAR